MKPLFLDCQTTGMHPKTGHLLELAWASERGRRSFLLALPEGTAIPRKVTEITGIRTEELAGAVPADNALAALREDLEALGPEAVVVAHYAQFERGFLPGALEGRPLLCTYKIAQRLSPEIPSRNIRALTGYFGLTSGEIRRAAEHVTATEKIWHQLSEGLASRGLGAFADIVTWLNETKPARAAKVEYRMDRLRRLALPDAPGVYRFLAKDGRVLYVGKATSLRSRVNSYFRSPKALGSRKREMVAQVWDVQVTECAHALAAALLENEEIKRLDPPYNVSLKTGDRQLVFLSRTLEAVSAVQDDAHPLGPFRQNTQVEALWRWRAGHGAGEPAQIFHEEVEAAVLEEGTRLFLRAHGFGEFPSLRRLVALGTWLNRALDALDPEPTEESEATPEEVEEPEELPLTAEEAALWYEGVVMGVAREVSRARRLTRLLDCRVHLGAGQCLEIHGGRLGTATAEEASHPWRALDLVDYDRMSVLLTEIGRCSYRVERASRPC